jgi:hypothetical protein
MKTFLACMMLTLVLIPSMYVYLVFLADRVAQIAGGYGVSMFLIPLFFGLFLGRITAGLLGAVSEKGWICYWWIILLGAFLANLPSLYYITFMMFFMEGS